VKAWLLFTKSTRLRLKNQTVSEDDANAGESSGDDDDPIEEDDEDEEDEAEVPPVEKSKPSRRKFKAFEDTTE